MTWQSACGLDFVAAAVFGFVLRLQFGKSALSLRQGGFGGILRYREVILRDLWASRQLGRLYDGVFVYITKQ